MVFGSWMGVPTVKPYPSPFAPSPVPPTPPRLPAEYQEVEWVQRLGGASIEIPDIINTRSIKMSFRIIGTAENRNYGLCAYDSTYSWVLRFYLTSGSCRVQFNVRGSSTTEVLALMPGFPLDFDLNITITSTSDGIKILVNNQERVLSPSYVDDQDPPRPLDIWKFSSYYSTNKVFEIVGRDSNDNSLRFDLVPCYRKSDGFCGFYDIVSTHFYTAQTEAGQYAHGDPIIY
jgi:hypothetical protein